MTTKAISRGEAMKFTAGADLTSGQGLLLGAIFGVVAGAVLSGATGVLLLTDVHELPKATGQAWTVGAKLYWDDTAKKVTTTSTSNTLIGIAWVAAASGDTVGQVRLNGASV